MSATTVPGAAILGDLQAEQLDLDRIVAGLADDDWHRPTPSAGWDVRDQIIHLAFVEELARSAATNAADFAATRALVAQGLLEFESSQMARGRRLSGGEVLAWWRSERELALNALGKLDPSDRLPWFGPPMSMRSFATARLMETWAHGCDIADALGVVRRPTNRLRHVAHIGVGTRGWSYAVRGLEPNTDPVLVELTAPDGELWSFGPQDASNHVAGTALDFCLVVTQRRRVEETEIVTTGDAASEWMRLAQAFAGPPTQRATS